MPKETRAQRSNVVPLRLVNSGTPRDCMAAVSELLNQCVRGEVQGLAYVVIKKGYEYTGDAAGLARENPTFAAGALDTLRTRLYELTVK